MLVKNIPYYVKFTFNCKENGACYCTCDKEVLAFIKYESSNESIYSLEIGDRIYIEPNTTQIYVVTDIAIRDIESDLSSIKYGVHSEDYMIYRLIIMDRFSILKNKDYENILMEQSEEINGLHELVVSILNVEGGFAENSIKNQVMMRHVITEELEKIGLSEEEIFGTK